MNINKREFDSFRDLEFYLHNFNDDDYEFALFNIEGDKWKLVTWEKKQ